MNFYSTNMNNVFVVAVLIVLSTIGITSVSAQSVPCLTDAETLAVWHWNSKQTDCNGGPERRARYWGATRPLLMDGVNTFCPHINSGCGQTVFGSYGFGNTNNFRNGVCMAGFNGGSWVWPYNHATGWDPTSTTFNPDVASFYVTYTFPQGTPGALTSFVNTVVSRGSADGSIQFEKEGIAVYRDGVMIYTTEEDLIDGVSANVPLRFEFPASSAFISDGSADVTFEIRFAMVHRLKRGISGLDDIMVEGVCGGVGGSSLAIAASDCPPKGANNGALTLEGFTAGEKFDWNEGSSYTGALDFSNAPLIPNSGIVVDTIGNKSVPTQYTVRVFRADCYQDITGVMPPTICPYNCDFPGATVASTNPTCNGTTAADDASVALTNILNATKIGISPGDEYTGPDFANATTLTGNSYTFSNLENPSCFQVYTIRLFNGNDGSPEMCIADYQVLIDQTSCDGCEIVCAKLLNTISLDEEPTNDSGSETACLTQGNIDLKLTKTVTPTTGAACPDETEFVWTVTVTNEGNIPANNILVFENLQEGLVAGNINPSVGTFRGVGNWDIPSLAPGASETLVFTSQASAPGTYENCAWIAQAFPKNDLDSSPDNTNTANEDDDDCATITVTGDPLPIVTKEFSPLTTRPNVPSTLIITLNNPTDDVIALTADFVDNLPVDNSQMVVAPNPNINSLIGGVVALPGATEVRIPQGSLLAPGLNLVRVDVVAPADGLYCNKIDIGDLQTTGCANIDSTIACLEVGNYAITPRVFKSVSQDMVEIGDTVVFTIQVENLNDVPLNVVQSFEDNFPEGLSLAGPITGSCPSIQTFPDSTLTVGFPGGITIPPGGCTINVPVTASVAGDYCNMIEQNALIVTVTVNGITEMIGNRSVAEACTEVISNPIFDLALRKTVATGTSDTIMPGDTARYEITLFNQGTADATDVQVMDYIPAELQFIADPMWTLVGSSAQLTTPIASLPAGAKLTLPISFILSPSFSGAEVVNAAEIISANGGTDKDSSADNDPLNDKGGKVNSPSDDVIFGNALRAGGAPGDQNGLTDEDDFDPAIIYRGAAACTVPQLTATNSTSGTCNGGTANNDADVDITGIVGADQANLSRGATYAGPAYGDAANYTLSGNALTIDTLAHSQQYTLRLWSAADSCFVDETFTTASINCVVPCVNPTAIVAASQGTCSGATANNDAQLNLTSITDTDQANFSQGATYTGPVYGSASNTIVGGTTLDFTGLMHNTQYTVRLWNSADGCYVDETFTTPTINCTVPITKVAVGNLVFMDNDDNGSFGAGDMGIDGVTVELYATTANPGVDAALATTTTMNGGFYLFDQLDAGSYIVYLPSGNFDTGGALSGKSGLTAQGGDDTTDDNNDENGQNTLVNGGIASTTIDLQPDMEPTGETGAGTYTGTLDDDHVNLTVDFGFETSTTPCPVPNCIEVTVTKN